GRRLAHECGAAVIGPSRIQLVIDGNAIPLANIADAIRLMQQFMPSAAGIGAVAIRDAGGTGEIVVQRGEPLAFGFGGNGVRGLANGWGEAEDWGTWSVSKRARIRFVVEKPGKGPIHADLRCRAFVHKRHPRLDVTCRIEGHNIAAWSCTMSAPSGTQRLTIPADIVPANGIFDLEFSMSEPRSPAELGASSDARLLGI